MERVILISAVFPPEPVVSASVSRDIAEHLSKKYPLTVICPRPTRPFGFRFEQSFHSAFWQTIRVNSFTYARSGLFGRLRESYSFGKHCAAAIRGLSDDTGCIYLNAWPLAAQYLIVRAAVKLKIPCVVHVQDLYPESLIAKLPFARKLFYRILLPADRYILRQCTAVITISEQMKQRLASTRGIGPDKITVAANWQNDEPFTRFREEMAYHDLPRNKLFTFMYLGNNGPLAGTSLLIKAFVRAGLRNARLVIAGSGSMTAACKDLARQHPEQVIDFIPVPEGMVPAVQSQADVLLLPVMKNAAMSSVPSKLPAYMFSSKPIVGCLDPESDTARAIVDSGCGLVVEPENETELAKAMHKCMSWSPGTRADKGNAGFVYAMKHYTRKGNLKQIVSVVENILNHDREPYPTRSYQPGRFRTPEVVQ